MLIFHIPAFLPGRLKSSHARNQTFNKRNLRNAQCLYIALSVYLYFLYKRWKATINEY